MAKKKKNKDIFDLLKHTEKFMVGGRVSNYVTDPSDVLTELQANKAQAMLEGETDFLGNAFGVLAQVAPAIMGAIGGPNGEGWGLINESITGKPYIKTILPGATVEKKALGGPIKPVKPKVIYNIPNAAIKHLGIKEITERKKDINSALNYELEYLNSPKFRERAIKAGYDVNTYKKELHNRLSNQKINFYDDSSEKTNGAFYDKSDNSINLAYNHKNPTSVLNYDTINHEVGHNFSTQSIQNEYINNKNALVPKDFIGDVIHNIKNNFDTYRRGEGHELYPEEVIADVHAARKQLYDAGVYDGRYSNFTEKAYKEMVSQSGTVNSNPYNRLIKKIGKEHNREIIKNYYDPKHKDHFKDTPAFKKAMEQNKQDIFDIMNRVVDNNSKNNTTNYAALGGTIAPNAEVEGDEVGITPDGQFLDFKGPDHEQGGIDVNLPEGTEMFSKRIKLVKEKGGKKVKKSIADWMKEEKEYDKKIAKKYDSDETDQLMKNTHKRATETTRGNIEKYKSIQKAFQKAQEELNQPILPEEMEGEQTQFALGGNIRPRPRPKLIPFLLNNENKFDPLQIEKLKTELNEDLNNIDFFPKEKNIEEIILPSIQYLRPRYIIPTNSENQDGVVPIDFGENAPDNNYYPSKMNLSAGKTAKDMLGYYTKEEISDMGDTLDSSTSTGDTKKSSLLDILKNAGSGLDFTLGDGLAIGGALKSAIDLKKNVLANRAGDKPNINPYLNYGQDALRTVEEMFNMQEIQKDDALHDAELSRNAAVSRNSNSARSINTLNALNLATDQQFNNAIGKIYANNAAALQKMMEVKADLQRDIDANVMKGAADKDMNDRRDRDAFYQNMNEVIKNSGYTAGQIGSYLNQMKQAKVSMNLVNELGRHGMRVAKDGTIEMIPGWNEKKGDVKVEEKKDGTTEIEKNAKIRATTLDPSKFSILKDDQKIKIAQEVGYANVRLDAQGNVLGDTIDRAGNIKTEIVIPFTSINDDIKSLIPFKKRKK